MKLRKLDIDSCRLAYTASAYFPLLVFSPKSV